MPKFKLEYERNRIQDKILLSCFVKKYIKNILLEHSWILCFFKLFNLRPYKFNEYLENAFLKWDKIKIFMVIKAEFCKKNTGYE